MRATTLAGSVGLVLAFVSSSHAGAADTPDTLITQGDDGTYHPAVATTWKAAGDTVVFELIASADAAAIAATLGESLATARVSVAAGKLTIAGIPSAALLNQLCNLSLNGEGADPLAELANVGGAVAMATPEGGGSIRASKTTELDNVPHSIPEHDPRERIAAEIINVQRGAFPSVTLTLKVRSNAKTGPLEKKLRRGTVIEAPVVLATGGNGVDFAETNTQRNLGAYYLARGDRVTIHAVSGKEGKVELDFVERQKKQ